MNELSRPNRGSGGGGGGGVYGKSYDRFVENHHEEVNSALTKVQQQYWATKQAVFRKLGKKEDEHVVASDFELDTKLELFAAIQESSCALQKYVEHYQDKILALSHEENALGRYLKENGKADKTRAGKMMQAVGKTMSYTSQQRLAIRVPLVRLHQEVETFRFRAISDTLVTVNQMEASRTDYRGALLWMKDISQELDPDTYKQLEKFRKVQTHVRKTKSHFDKLKVDCLQKVDLLAASRCNMFSHALATYQNTLLQFWEKSSKTMTAISESFKGYQHYEFNMLKELTDVGKKLAEGTTSTEMKAFLNEDGEIDKDRLIFFEEYHDENDDTAMKEKKENERSDLNSDATKNDSLQNLFETTKQDTEPSSTRNVQSATDVPLLDLMSDSTPGVTSVQENSTIQTSKIPLDLLTNNPDVDDSEKDNMTLLNEILNAHSTVDSLDTFDSEWDSVFNRKDAAVTANDSTKVQSSFQDFLPSQLLDMKMATLNFQELGDNSTNGGPVAAPVTPEKKATSSSKTNHSSKKQPMSAPSKKVSSSTKDMSAWFNLFADLDPLANPDAVGKSSGTEVDDDRNC